MEFTESGYSVLTRVIFLQYGGISLGHTWDASQWRDATEARDVH